MLQDTILGTSMDTSQGTSMDPSQAIVFVTRGIEPLRRKGRLGNRPAPTVRLPLFFRGFSDRAAARKLLEAENAMRLHGTGGMGAYNEGAVRTELARPPWGSGRVCVTSPIFFCR